MLLFSYFEISGISFSAKETIENIKNSFLVYIIGELDVTSFFELGLAISLGKTVYYVTQKEYSNYDFKLPYELDGLISIEHKTFIAVVNKIFV